MTAARRVRLAGRRPSRHAHAAQLATRQMMRRQKNGLDTGHRAVPLDTLCDPRGPRVNITATRLAGLVEAQFCPARKARPRLSLQTKALRPHFGHSHHPREPPGSRRSASPMVASGRRPTRACWRALGRLDFRGAFTKALESGFASISNRYEFRHRTHSYLCASEFAGAFRENASHSRLPSSEWEGLSSGSSVPFDVPTGSTS
ncbi:hypothetical protein D9M68_444950 [compost metagenome]